MLSRILVVLALFATSTVALLPPPDGTFSIAVIPDTQRYRGKDTKAEPDSDAPVTNEVFHGICVRYSLAIKVVRRVCTTPGRE